MGETYIIECDLYPVSLVNSPAHPTRQGSLAILVN